MEITDSQPEVKGFEVKRIVEQTPLRDEASKSFFDKWCEINDSIIPQIASRQYWERHVKDQGILRRNPNGTSTLFIPEDIHLWEMLGVTEAIDRDTFAKKPEVWKEKKQKIQDLGKMFRNSGIYLAQRINSIQQGSYIAEGLAQEFFAYGNALSTGYMGPEQKEIPIEKIALKPISPEDTEKVDRWLSGDSLYRSRMARVEKEIDNRPSTEVDQIIENTRQATLNQFFRTAEKAFTLNAKTNANPLIDNSKPWSTSSPIHSVFLRNLESKLKKTIEIPKSELLSPIFRRGVEKLLNEIGSPNKTLAIKNFIAEIKIFPNPSRQKLVDSLRVEDMKEDLKKAQQTKDLKQISEKEIEITRKIQQAVSNYLFKDFANNPSEMINEKRMNCLGRTFLAGALLKEIGINYLQGDIPDHAIIILVTSDRRIFWEDMQNTRLSGELHTRDIQGKSQVGKDFDISDIADLSKNQNFEGITLELISRESIRRMPWVKKGEKKYVSFLPPESGQIAMLLGNTTGLLIKEEHFPEALEILKWAEELTPNAQGLYITLANVFYKLGRYEEAIDQYKKAIAQNPNNISLYNQLGNAFRRLDRYQEAIQTYEQAVRINPKDEDAYNGLGNILYIMDRNQEALRMYGNAIYINPKSAHPHNGSANILMEMGDYINAIRAFEKFISLADKKYDSSFILRAKEQIQECQSKLQE